MISPLNREAISTASYLCLSASTARTCETKREREKQEEEKTESQLTLDLPVPVAPTTATRGRIAETRRGENKEEKEFAHKRNWTILIVMPSIPLRL